jgi:hypothetical protein
MKKDANSSINGNIVEIISCRKCGEKKVVFEHSSGNTFSYKEYAFTSEKIILEGDPVTCSLCQIKNRAM